MMAEQMLAAARAACEAAVRAGADMAEVRAAEGRGTSVRVERSAVDATESRSTRGASIRAFSRGGLGSVSLDGLDADTLVAAAKQATEMARSAASDRDFKTLPGPSPCPEVAGIYDPRIEDVGVDALAGIIMESVQAARDVAPDALCTGSADAYCGVSALANSLGVALTARSSHISAWVQPVIRRGDDVGSFYEWDAACRMADFDHRQMGATAAETAVCLLGSGKIESGVLSIVLGPLAANSVFHALAASAEAESHQRGRSWLQGRLGQKIASDVVTIHDDPLIPAGLGSRPYDSEGVPGRRMAIIENGVLVNLLHNSYTANKAGVPYTGHARGGGIGPANVVPALGTIPARDIIAQVDRGLYINMGSLSPDGTTGEVSASVDFGFLIENGEITRGVSSTMIGMNGFEMLANIDAVSSDARVEPGMLMPAIRIQNVRVAGGSA